MDEALTPERITALLNAPKRTRGSSKNYYYTLELGTFLKRNSGKPSADEVGSHYGNVGTMYRSRKGAVRRRANGSRQYSDIGATVVAYRITP